MQAANHRLFAFVFAVVAASFRTYALPAVCPVLPPVADADTETVTNLPFAAWERELREFRFDLVFIGSASNNVEMAFGTDADGNGELSEGEIDVIAGWDCGELFIANNASGERLASAAAEGLHDFSCVCGIRPNGQIGEVVCTDNEKSVFGALSAAKPAWLHSRDWNALRLTGRGENVRSGERFAAKITPTGFFIRLM